MRYVIEVNLRDNYDINLTGTLQEKVIETAVPEKVKFVIEIPGKNWDGNLIEVMTTFSSLQVNGKTLMKDGEMVEVDINTGKVVMGDGETLSISRT